MTDDIVARLREDAEDHKDVAGCCDCDPKDTRNWQHALNNEEAADEIERLREMRADWRAAMTENHDLWRENERLRAALREIAAYDTDTDGNWGFFRDEADAALAEEASDDAAT